MDSRTEYFCDFDPADCLILHLTEHEKGSEARIFIEIAYESNEEEDVDVVLSREKALDLAERIQDYYGQNSL